VVEYVKRWTERTELPKTRLIGWPSTSSTTTPCGASASGYLTPADKLNGLAQVIFDERDRKLEQARQRRQQARQALREVA
jgi:hypothetical protein